MNCEGIPRVLIVDPVHRSLVSRLSQRYNVVEHLGPDQATLRSLLTDAHAIVLRSGVQLNRAAFDAAPLLRFVARAGVGVDNIDIDYARQRGIAVFNVPDLSAISVAEFTFGLILALMRKITIADRQLRASEWRKSELIGNELDGKTLGIFGLGRIGYRVSRIAKGFNMNVIASVARPDPDRAVALEAEGIGLVANEELLASSDILSLHCPLTQYTRGIIDAGRLALMRPHAYLVNMARGGVVDEEALHQALFSGKIKGAASDVFGREKEDNPLIHLPNFVASPHIGAMTDEAQMRIADTLLADLERGFSGHPIVNRVT